MNQPRTPIPDWKLERLRLGELPDVERQLLLADFAGDAPSGPSDRVRSQLETQLAQLELSDRALLERLPPTLVAAEVHRRKHSLEVARDFARPRPRFAWMSAVAAGAVVVSLVRLFPSGFHLDERRGTDKVVETTDITREKGLRSSLRIYRHRDDRSEMLQGGDAVRPGDRLQLSYVATATHGIIVSIDGRGAVTRHFPEGSSLDTRLDRQKEVLLAHSYELDDAPDFERFFFITSNAALPVSQVLEAVSVLAKDKARARQVSLDLETVTRSEKSGSPSNDIEQMSILLEKR